MMKNYIEKGEKKTKLYVQKRGLGSYSEGLQGDNMFW